MKNVKSIVILAFAAALALLAGCGEEKVVEFGSLQQRGGVYVVPETQKPYSGKFVETRENVVIKAGSLKNGKLHGEFTTYREDGSIDKIETFADDVLNEKRNFENGKLTHVEHYKDGKLDGKSEFYNENGKLMSVFHFKAEELDGKWENYYESGKLMGVGYFKDGKEDGKWESYYESGKLMGVGYFKDGKEDGKWENYYESGKLMGVWRYIDGKLYGKRELYDENRKLIQLGQLGSFRDSRDGKTYNTVKIGSQTWMAENLNYNASGSECWANDESYCQKYGRLYKWVTAMKVCPSGWHLPSDEEWQKLVDIAGGDEVAGTKLKIMTMSAKTISSNNTDEFGFSALLGGCYSPPSGYYSDGFFIGAGDTGEWWSASEDDRYNAYNRRMFFNDSAVSRNSHDKSNLYSVRCVDGNVDLSELDLEDIMPGSLPIDGSTRGMYYEKKREQKKSEKPRKKQRDAGGKPRR